MSDTKTMTPDELLKDANYVVMCGDGNYRFIPGVFAEKSEADAHANRMNSYGHSRYSVVEIDRTDKDDDALTLLEGDCEMFQSRSEHLGTAMEMVCDYIEDECAKLRKRHESESFLVMSTADRYRYECDRESYAAMSTIYALISGATLGEHGGTMGGFPIPDFD